jgi:hypothetical protein
MLFQEEMIEELLCEVTWWAKDQQQQGKSLRPTWMQLMRCFFFCYLGIVI